MIIAALAVAFTLASRTFADGGSMPISTVYNSYGCKGGNIAPELHWSGAPAGTKSFALTAHDPDAAVPGGWWHWVVLNIPATMTSLGDVSPNASAMRDVIFGTTTFKSAGWGGPCPPPGTPHHYVFTLYALNIERVPGASGSTTAPQLLQAIAGHIVGKASLTGLYGR